MLSAKPWKPEAVLFLFGGVCLCILAGGLLINLLYPDSVKTHQMTFGGAALSVLCFHGVALGLIGVFVRKHRVTWKEAFGFLNQWKLSIGLGCLGCIVFYFIGQGLQDFSIWLLEKIFHEEPAQQAAVKALGTADSWSQQIFMLVTMVLLAPVVEEILFRGILYPLIKQAGFPKIAVFGVSLLFAAVHFTPAIFLPLFVLAMLLTWLYEFTDNLLAPITAHSLFNAMGFALYYWQKYH